MVFQNGKHICRFYLTSIALYSEMLRKCQVVCRADFSSYIRNFMNDCRIVVGHSTKQHAEITMIGINNIKTQ